MSDGTPYAVRLSVTGTGDQQAVIDPAQRNSGGANRHALGPGTYGIAVDWQGPEAFTVVLATGGAETYPAYVYGSGPDRSTRLFYLTVGAGGGYVRAGLLAVTQATLDAKRAGAIRIYPLPDYTP